jgi:hypothetical protein
MAFCDRRYEVFVLLGDATREPLWRREVWLRAAATLDELIAGARGKAALRTQQHGADGAAVRFGRIGWDDDGHRAWTHEAGDARTFSSLEAWAPSWTVSERDRSAPDVFLALRNEALLAATPRFNPTLLLAVATDLPALQHLAEQSLPRLADLTAAPLVARQRRRWGTPFGPDGDAFTDSLQDLIAIGLFRPGSPHERPVDVATLAGRWRRIG